MASSAGRNKRQLTSVFALTSAYPVVDISGYILFEAYQRFRNRPAVESLGMLGVATIGLIVNPVGMFLLRRGATESLNLKGASSSNHRAMRRSSLIYEHPHRDCPAPRAIRSYFALALPRSPNL